jgi:hypothetical protein
LSAEGHKLLEPSWKKKLQRRKLPSLKLQRQRLGKSDGSTKAMAGVAPEAEGVEEDGVASWVIIKVARKMVSLADHLDQAKSVMTAAVDDMLLVRVAVALEVVGLAEVEQTQVLEAREAVVQEVVQEALASNMKLDPVVRMSSKPRAVCTSRVTKTKQKAERRISTIFNVWSI